MSVVRAQSQEKLKDISDLNASNNGIIASVGSIDISVNEFLTNYQFGPAFFKRQKDSRNRYLTVMIYEKLLALDGYQKDLHLNASVRRTMKAYEDDILTEELYKEKIMNRISVSEAEIEGMLPLARKQIEFEWIYTAQQDTIFKIWNQLNKGLSFDSLFRAQLSDSLQKEGRSQKSTIYKLKYEQPELYAIINVLTLGNYSDPVNGPDGWYIFKIRNIWQNMILTESEEYKLKHELERSLFKTKLDIESDKFVQTLMNEENAVIDRNNFKRIVYFLNERAASHVPYDQAVLESRLKQDDESAQQTDAINDDADLILVSGKTVKIRIRDFNDWYAPRAVYLKFPADSPENFILTAQRFVWRMVRDYLLVSEAEKYGYTERTTVTEQSKWWEDKIVFNAVKAELAMSINYDEKALRDYYTDNWSNYKYDSGEAIPFDKARRNVESDLRKEVYMNKLMRRVLTLKSKYTIDINQDLLKTIDLQDENGPSTIEFYTVKKGGLLPRQPYPTIDWDWQLWY